jgi:UDP-N-acetylglucosamine/UDP-N-acetylgalactosamine diphosphorylase
VVWKAHAAEKVGVVAQRNGKPCVVEYSEMDDATKALTDPSTAKLTFGAGNICNHYFTLPFVRDTVLSNLQNLYHAARKKIPTLAFPSTTPVKPDRENGAWTPPPSFPTASL